MVDLDRSAELARAREAYWQHPEERDPVICSADAAAYSEAAALSEINQTLASRQSVYGDFRDVADTAQELKNLFAAKEEGLKLNNEQREALDLIATKIARLLHGNPNDRNSWHDIAGYATLAERACDVVD